MKKAVNTPLHIRSISELHRHLSLPKPEHPLISVVQFEDINFEEDRGPETVMLDFYTIAIKKGFKGKMRYGQNYYDFDEGVMSFLAPGQITSSNHADDQIPNGWMLVMHPDFILGYPLAKAIKDYGFFSYELFEALHLSEKENVLLESIILNIQQEYRSGTDIYSTNLIVSYIELLLNYSNRFYNRQFITRRRSTNDLLTRLEGLLDAYFDSDIKEGLPTVQYISSQLNVSASYLSDMLRSVTGQNAQQHIHNHLIEKAKVILTTTTFSVSEIAYQLGFEYPQYFSKLFKSKTNVSPLEFRQSFS
ncbi:helix-turn-helix domain-containing protein [Pedobacter metabolipauper]|uniref:AraC family transcriptional regulator n=1 Tax=Pedobacter metabolipauper TaxID=425513 RepID=A0A4R6SP18_9SPHI|nr:response regulator transcription factor [Pedobacter metabolipauper]TDQ06208.1 AraC family transcriptional regulator [Pedobacter metabolipauper]